MMTKMMITRMKIITMWRIAATTIINLLSITQQQSIMTDGMKNLSTTRTTRKRMMILIQ